jgi:DNA recombination protein RmuC
LTKLIKPKKISHKAPLTHVSMSHLCINRLPIISSAKTTPVFVRLAAQAIVKVTPDPKVASTASSIHHRSGLSFQIIIPAPPINNIPATNPPHGRGCMSLMYNFLEDMDGSIYIILSVILGGFIVTWILLRRWLSRPSPQDPLISDWLHTSTSQINQRIDLATQLMASVQKNLGEMSEIGRGIKSFQEFIQSPKLRGGLGEEVLKEMLGQTFPKNSFHLQYSFKSGAKVDAALKTDAGILCIDSKFPLENFQLMLKSDSEEIRQAARHDFISDVKKHILDISKKYILPAEGTTDFALMYIPSEAVYYEVANLPQLISFSREARVYPVSPNTLYAHLQVLLLSFEGKELEAKSRQVFQLLRAIHKDYAKVEENMSVLNRHLTNAHNQMGNVSQALSGLGQKISQTHFLHDSPAVKDPEELS